MIRILLNNLLLLSFWVLLQSCQKSSDEYFYSAKKLIDDNKTTSKIQAIAELDNLLEINPNHAQAYLLRAKAKFIIQNYKKILSDSGYSQPKILKKIKSDPQFHGVLSDYNKALELDKNLELEVYDGKGDAFFALKKYKKALNSYNKMLIIDSTIITAYSKIIGCKEELNDTIGAKIIIEKMVNSNKSNPRSYFQRAIYKLTLLEDKKGACVDLHKSLSLLESQSSQQNRLKDEIEKLININCD